MFKIIDTHCHLSFSAFNKDREDIINKIKKEDMGVIEVGTSIKTSKTAVELASKNKNIWASVGTHPTESSEEFDKEEYSKILKNPRVVAVGECGLDYYHSSKDSEQAKSQEGLFRKHIELAKEAGLPLILHCRDPRLSDESGASAHEDVLEILRSYKELTGTVHFFTGTAKQAKEYISLGFYVGLDGPITFTSEYDELIKELPLEKILIETDSPYAAPAPYRGKRNEPTYVVEIAKKIATLKNMSQEEVVAQTTKNAYKLFNL